VQGSLRPNVGSTGFLEGRTHRVCKLPRRQFGSAVSIINATARASKHQPAEQHKLHPPVLIY